MTPIDKLWRAVRKATSFPSVISRFEIWLDEVWPQARQQGLTKRSTRGVPVPDVVIDEFANPWWAADYYDGTIRLPPSESIDLQFTRFFGWGSPTLNDPPPPKLDYVRASVIHELRHAFDHVDGHNIFLHDRHFWRRLTKLEVRFDPRGIA